MCGRYTEGRHRPEKAEKALGELIKRQWPDLPPRYNVSPGTNIPVIRLSAENGAELTELKWGLLPYWCKEPRIAYNTINAMAETMETKASYRVPFKKRRCLIPADGWYEWQPLKSGKQKWWFHRADDTDFCFAGLWDRWHRGDQIVETCTIVITEAAESIRHVHDRMPVIIDPKDYQFWLDPAIDYVPALKDLLKPTSDALEAIPVANPRQPRDDDATLIKPAPQVVEPPTLF
jgi:putative SOS response-associated peptidase YedK